MQHFAKAKSIKRIQLHLSPEFQFAYGNYRIREKFSDTPRIYKDPSFDASDTFGSWKIHGLPVQDPKTRVSSFFGSNGVLCTVHEYLWFKYHDMDGVPGIGPYRRLLELSIRPAKESVPSELIDLCLKNDYERKNIDDELVKTIMQSQIVLQPSSNRSL